MFVTVCAVPIARAAGPPCAASMPAGLIGSALNTNFQINSIDVQGSYAYVGDWTSYFRVYDLTNPCIPTLLSSVPTGQEMDDVAVSGAYAYLANDANGLAIYDISDPANPQPVTSRSDGAYANNIFYNGGSYAWVGYIYTGNMAVYNVSSFPPIPVPVLKFFAARHVFDISVDQARNRAYVLISEPTIRLEILDITDLNNLVTKGEVTLPYAQYGDIGEIRVLGNNVYIAMGQNSLGQGGLRIIDISNEAAPFVVGSYTIPNLGGTPFKGAGLAVLGGRAYVTGFGGVYVFGISTPAQPSLVSTLPLPPSAGNAMAGHIEIRDGLAYVTVFALDSTSKGGIAIYKLTPANKDECKNGGWQWLGRADGSVFRNQGDCIQYVNTGK